MNLRLGKSVLQDDRGWSLYRKISNLVWDEHNWMMKWWALVPIGHLPIEPIFGTNE